MVVVRPFAEVVGEFLARSVSSGVLKVNHNELLVLIRSLKER